MNLQTAIKINAGGPGSGRHKEIYDYIAQRNGNSKTQQIINKFSRIPEREIHEILNDLLVDGYVGVESPGLRNNRNNSRITNRYFVRGKLQAGEEMVEREGVGKVPGLKGKNTEGSEPPRTGAYSARHTPKDKYFDDPGIDGAGTSEGATKGWDSRGRGKKDNTEWNPFLKDAYERASHKPGYVYPEQFGLPHIEVHDEQPRFKSLQDIQQYQETMKQMEEMGAVPQYPGDEPLVKMGNREKPDTIDADVDGEPGGPAMQHMFLNVRPTSHPPSLTKRGKQTHVPVDDVGETDDRWLDVAKRNSRQTNEDRMKILKRSSPAPAAIPVRAALPSSMMASKKPMLKQRPVNWDKRACQKVSYARRGCM